MDKQLEQYVNSNIEKIMEVGNVSREDATLYFKAIVRKAMKSKCNQADIYDFMWEKYST